MSERKRTRARSLVSATVRPTAARALLGYLVDAERRGISHISTYDLRRIALCGLPARRSQKDRFILRVTAFARWRESWLPDLSQDEQQAITAVLGLPDAAARLAKITSLILQTTVVERERDAEARA